MIHHRADLCKIIPNISEAVCAELGAAESYFAADIARWGVKKVYVIDLWESHPEFPGDAGSPQDWHNKNYVASLKRLKEFGERVEILRGPTTAMAQLIKEPLDYVNVDACHSFKCVMNDINAYWPKMKSGAVMSFHDYEMKQYGVKHAVKDFADRHNLHIHLLSENKTEDAGAYLVKS